MKLTKLEEQGMRLAMCLARARGQMTLLELSCLEGMTEALAAKVLGRLRAGGIVSALRGRHGGYALARPPTELTVCTVLRSLGRPLVDGCFTGSPGQRQDPCPHVDACGIRPVWEFIGARIEQVLDQMTLADLLEREEHIRARLTSLDRASGRTAASRYTTPSTCSPRHE
ncbi:MAG TPA: Rrf2 family transcriptional regulator [Polyangia bacterium]|nr:Rrf2 family transcriptional regulator [Polyangia bacterium]